MFKNSYFRLLMNLSGVRLLSPDSEETPESAWIIPGDLSADGLKDAIHFINQAEFSPPTFEEGVLAEHQLKRKPPPPKKAAFDDDDDDGELDGVPLFPKGGPTARKVIDENGKDKPKKARKKRRPLTEEEKEERRRKKKKSDHEKHMNIKSTEFVRDSDDEFTLEEDEAFFAREREIAAQAARARAGTQAEDAVVGKSGGTALRKRARATKAAVGSSDDEGSDKDDFIRRAMDGTIEDEDEGETSQDDSDGEARKRRRVSTESEDENEDEDEDEEMGGMDNTADKEAKKEAKKEADKADEDEDVAPVAARRPRARGGFLMDSDDDE